MTGPYEFRYDGIVDRISEWASASLNTGHSGIDHYFTKFPFLEKVEQLSGENSVKSGKRSHFKTWKWEKPNVPLSKETTFLFY